MLDLQTLLKLPPAGRMAKHEMRICTYQGCSYQ